MKRRFVSKLILWRNQEFGPPNLTSKPSDSPEHEFSCRTRRANGGLLSACLAMAVLICLAPAAIPAGASRQPAARPFEPSSSQDQHWAVGFHAPGVAGMDAEVLALSVGPVGSIYAGGTFVTAGDVVANGIARWDGSRWHSLGGGMSGGSSYASHVYAVAAGPDGSVYAGGEFAHAGGVAVNNIARWDATTSSWDALGDGVDGEVYALAIGQDGSLYVGGEFYGAGGAPANRIARWDGASWHSLSTGIDGIVYALAVAPDGSLYVGGGFYAAGGVWASQIARWDGSAWYAVGDGITGPNQPFGCYVYALAVGPDGIVYAAGSFTTAGGMPAVNIARWDGVIWHPLRRGIPNYSAVFALATGPDGSVYAGFWGGDGRVLRWDGADWQAMAGGMPGGYWVHALAAGLDGSIYAGGRFEVAGQAGAGSIARWDGALWHPLGSGNGMNSDVRALAVGPAGALYAGGAFRTAGDRIVDHVTAWDGASWQALGSGTSGDVAALAVGPDGTLYAGGEFVEAGGITANNIARWDSSTSSWRALGSGIIGYSGVFALLMSPDGSLYAGGDFWQAGGTPAYGIARWDGTTSSWHALGSGVAGGYSVAVRALAMGPDGTLYVGGHFITAGGVGANNLARWNPTNSSWQAVGSGMNGAVLALAFGPDGSLYAGGEFTSAGGVPANYVARWDGGQWHALDSGMSGGLYDTHVDALAIDPDGSVYAGGNFTAAGEAQANRIARWDGAAWQPLASGMAGTRVPAVFSLAFDMAGSLCAGGDFSTAGDVPSAFIARWDAFALPTSVNRYLPLISHRQIGDLP